MLQEIVVDSFAGGGGASTGIELALQALGVPDAAVDIAINHSGPALAMHEANHPAALHLESDIWTVDPLATTAGRPVGLMWASPDCRHFSRAKGSTPVSKKVRGLAWSILHWAEQVQPRIVILENVEEFTTWGPLIVGPKGYEIPDPERVGETFKAWVAGFKKAGYRVEWKVLRACDYGAPTIRRRLYIIMRRDGEKIVWPKATHGDPTSPAVRAGRRLPWVTAAEIIDWSLACPPILMTREEGRAYTAATGRKIIRPLADNTLARIAAGFKRYVLKAATPSFITTYYGESAGKNDRAAPVNEPLRTITTEPRFGVVEARLAPFLSAYYGSDQDTPVTDPLHTVTTKDRFDVIQATLAPFMTAHYGSDVGSPVTSPVRTITGIPKVEPVVGKLVRPPLTPEHLVSAQRVADFLRAEGVWQEEGLVTIGEHVVVDMGMRMLTPRELARAQGFPDNYILAAPYQGGTLSESDQRHKLGNSVCPPVAQALVAANYRPQSRSTERAEQGWLFEEAA